MPIEMTFQDTIAAPPERVFAALTDLDGAQKWMPNLVRIERLTPEKTGVGMRWRETRKMFGREASEEFEVTGLEPGKKVELYVDGTKGSSRRGYYRFRYELQPSGGSTLLRLHGEIGGMGKLMELVGRLFMGPFKKAMAKDLEAMKRYIESSRPG
jgi:uncharacterized protein YndB with AHSA1/START domain